MPIDLNDLTPNASVSFEEPFTHISGENSRAWSKKAADNPHLHIPLPEGLREKGIVRGKHSHYYKDCKHLDFIDVYRVIDLFAISDPCIQHALKKLLVAGGRGAGKDISKDIQESIDSLKRWQEMQQENQKGNAP